MKGKRNAFIMGDSYTTYKGHIPENYNYYYSDERTDAPIVAGVEKTWWKILEKQMDYNIVVNDSYSGSTICKTGYDGYCHEISFVGRLEKYIEDRFFATNEIDTFFVFGGTNDSWADSPIGELKYSNYTEEDLKCVLPAFCYLLGKAKPLVRKIVVILNTELKQEIVDGYIKACEKFDVNYICLKEIDKEGGHPTALGMKQIAEQVEKCLF